MQRSKRNETTSSNRPLNEPELALVIGGNPTAVTYQKIETVWKDGNIASLDDWQKAP